VSGSPQVRTRYVLYGGARMGGKSRWLRWCLLWRNLLFAKRAIRQVKSGLFTESYSLLETRFVGLLGRCDGPRGGEDPPALIPMCSPSRPGGFCDVFSRRARLSLVPLT
jgi:hypothetical protein